MLQRLTLQFGVILHARQREAHAAGAELGHEARADNLDRAPEVKLGPVVSAIERREQRAAEREEWDYVPLTERGAADQAAPFYTPPFGVEALVPGRPR